jgi:hypothetical protein
MQINIQLTEEEAKVQCEIALRDMYNIPVDDARVSIEIKRDDIPNYEWAAKHKAFMAKFVFDAMGKLNRRDGLLLVELIDAVYKLLEFEVK